MQMWQRFVNGFTSLAKGQINAECDTAVRDGLDILIPANPTKGSTNARLLPQHSGTASAGGGSTITLVSGASTSNDFYNGSIVYITKGTGVGQCRQISDYVGSTLVATVSVAWVTNPDGTSEYVVIPNSPILATVDPGASIKAIQSGQATISSGATTGDSTITAVVIANCLLVHNGEQFSINGDERQTCNVNLETTTVVRAARYVNTASTTLVRWTLVEFE